MTNKIIALVASLAAFSVSAVTLEHSVHHGTTQAVTQVNKVAEIDGSSYGFKYVKDRASFDGINPDTGSNTGGVPVTDNNVVSADLTLTSSITDVTQTITGVSAQNTFTDYTAIRGGGIVATEGNRITDVNSNIDSATDGYTYTTTATYSVSTSTSGNYDADNAIGNDVEVKIGSFEFGTNPSSIDISAAFDQALKHVDPSEISIDGQQLDYANSNGIELNWDYKEVGVTDTSTTNTVGASRTYTVFSTID